MVWEPHRLPESLDIPVAGFDDSVEWDVRGAPQGMHKVIAGAVEGTVIPVEFLVGAVRFGIDAMRVINDVLQLETGCEGYGGKIGDECSRAAQTLV